LVKESGGNIIQHNFLIELGALNGRALLEKEDIFSLIFY
jgi:adenine/guanine phosphoribosyltransferase-like PRPP-binding protein